MSAEQFSQNEPAAESGYGYVREIEIKFRKRRVKNEMANCPVSDPQHVFDLFSHLQDETKEKMITMSLDAKLMLLCYEVVALGSVHSIHARPFEAIRASLPLNPTGIILVHNHPSGDPEPSESDREFTRALKTVTDAAGLKFHDHIIIGEGNFFSFAHEGLL